MESILISVQRDCKLEDGDNKRCSKNSQQDEEQEERCCL